MAKEGIYNIVIGTADHIDHGKSSIVRRLTGVDPDRLSEEKARGLTIDLGFAPLALSDGRRVGLIDVPGHERFIKNMVAGATGIDLVVLVVAADDSVMPQTREHLDIMTLLNVQRGLIVINKIDLAEPEMVELVEEEVRETVEGTFLEGAPCFHVSAVTGAGFEEFQAGLEAAIQEVPQRTGEGIFRMPIQRVFSSKGHGTVVTGIPVSGSVKVGDRLEVLPLDDSGRVRGLQAYRLQVDVASCGHSTAINLGDIDFHEVHRGMVAAEPGYFRSATMIEAKVRVLSSLDRPLLHQTPVRFHTGTAEVVGTIYLLEEKSAEPGSETYAQFRLQEPIVVAPGDRYVFRQESPMITLGGGEVLNRSAWRLKTGKSYVLDALRRKESALGSKENFVLSLAQDHVFEVTRAKDLAPRASLPVDEVKQILSTLGEEGELVEAPSSKGDWACREGVELAEKRILNAMEECYDKDPYRVYLNKLEVQQTTRLSDDFFQCVLALLEQKGQLAQLRGGRLSLPSREVKLSAAEKEAYDLISSAYANEPFSPPSLEELAERSNKDAKLLEKVAGLLLDEENLVKITPDVVLHKQALEEGIKRVRALFEEMGPFPASKAKDSLETSRKFAIPFLEYLDRIKVTRRVGELREIVGQ